MREVTLHSSPDSMGGAKRFPNTRVPVSLFFLNLAEGVGIDRFCRGYPRVDPEDCRRVLAAAQAYIERRDEAPVEPDVGGADNQRDEVARDHPEPQRAPAPHAHSDGAAEERKRAHTIL